MKPEASEGCLSSPFRLADSLAVQLSVMGKSWHRCTKCINDRTRCDAAHPYCGRCAKKAKSRGVSAFSLCKYEPPDTAASRQRDITTHVVNNMLAVFGEEEKAKWEEKNVRNRMEREKEAKAEQEQRHPPHKIRGRRGAAMMAALSTATVTPSAAGGATAQPNRFPSISHMMQEMKEQERNKVREAMAKLLAEQELGSDSLHKSNFGGNGVVVRAWKLSDANRVFALKVAKLRLLGEDDTARVLHELRHLQLCNDLPNVVQLARFTRHEPPGVFCVEGEVCGIVMEHIESVKLSVAAEDERWWNGAAVSCIAALLHGVRGLHNRRIIHCDIKPSNVLICPSLSDVKICDLGNASNDTAGAEKYGTQGFRCPENPRLRERLFGDGAKAMEAWAVGVTALCFVCGCGDERLVDVEHGQDYELLCRARDAGAAGEVARGDVWTLTLAKQCNKRILSKRSVYAWIARLLALNPSTRLDAMCSFETDCHVRGVGFLMTVNVLCITKEGTPALGGSQHTHRQNCRGNERDRRRLTTHTHTDKDTDTHTHTHTDRRTQTRTQTQTQDPPVLDTHTHAHTHTRTCHTQTSTHRDDTHKPRHTRPTEAPSRPSTPDQSFENVEPRRTSGHLTST